METRKSFAIRRKIEPSFREEMGKQVISFTKFREIICVSPLLSRFENEVSYSENLFEYSLLAGKSGEHEWVRVTSHPARK